MHFLRYIFGQQIGSYPELLKLASDCCIKIFPKQYVYVVSLNSVNLLRLFQPAWLREGKTWMIINGYRQKTRLCASLLLTIIIKGPLAYNSGAPLTHAGVLSARGEQSPHQDGFLPGHPSIHYSIR